MGESTAALEHLKEAYALLEGNEGTRCPSVVRHLTILYERLGDIETARTFFEQFAQFPLRQRVVLGIHPLPSGDPTGALGVVVGEILAESPAARADLRPRDRITQLGLVRIERLWDLDRAIALYRGEETELTAQRDGERVLLPIRLQD